MTNKQAKSRVEKLKKLINEYRYEYHVNDKSIMPEAAADGLKKELSDLEAQYPELITADSPTQRVAGKPLDKFEKAQHSKRMLSLNDAFSFGEINEWLERISKIDKQAAQAKLFVDLKLDGLALALTYKEGRLVQALTRGDGTVGEVVTENARTVDSVPLSLPEAIDIEVRGELVMHKADFQKLNQQRKKASEEEFKNPRNLAAGTMRQLDSKLVAARPLTFYGYELISQPALDNDRQYKKLSDLGFKTGKIAQSIEASDLPQFLDKWQEKRRRGWRSSCRRTFGFVTCFQCSLHRYW